MEEIQEKKYVKKGHAWWSPWEEREIAAEYRFAQAGRADLNRFNKEVQKSPEVAQRNLVLAVIHPEDKEKFQAEVEKYPGLLLTFAAWALKASGLESDLGN